MARFTELLTALLMATTSAMDCSPGSCEGETSFVQISRKLKEGGKRECPAECNLLPGSFHYCTDVAICGQCPKCVTHAKIHDFSLRKENCEAAAVNGRKIILIRHTMMHMQATQKSQIAHIGNKRGNGTERDEDGFEYADKIGKGLASYIAEGSIASMSSPLQTSMYHQVKGASGNKSSIESGAYKVQGKAEMHIGESTLLYSQGFNSIAEDVGIRKLQCGGSGYDPDHKDYGGGHEIRDAAAEERIQALDPDHKDYGNGRCGGMIAEQLDDMLIDLLQSSKFPAVGDVVVVGSREWILHFLDIATGGTEANGDYNKLKGEGGKALTRHIIKASEEELDNAHMFAGNAFVFECPDESKKWSISVVQLRELGEAYVAGMEDTEKKVEKESLMESL